MAKKEKATFQNVNDGVYAHLSPREIELALLVWKCMIKEPQIDYDALMKVSGLGTKASARTGWGAAKRKILDAKLRHVPTEDTSVTDNGTGDKEPEPTAFVPLNVERGRGRGRPLKRKAAEEILAKNSKDDSDTDSDDDDIPAVIIKPLAKRVKTSFRTTARQASLAKPAPKKIVLKKEVKDDDN